jgi:uncharacterized protein (TIGR02246 family)
MRKFIVALVLLIMPSVAAAGPKEDALTAFDAFLTTFTSADANKMVSLFTPDALFYGTTSPELVTKPEGVLAYFTAAFGTPARQPGSVVAKRVSAEAVALSDSAAVVSGKWLTERMVDGRMAPGAPLRVSLLVVKRNDSWLVAQFHNSAMPAQAPAPAPAPR